MGYPILLKPSS